MSDSVAVEIRETDGGRSVAVVPIDRRPINAIDDAMKERLLCVAAELGRDDSVGVVELFGERVFSAGDDIKQMAAQALLRWWCPEGVMDTEPVIISRSVSSSPPAGYRFPREVIAVAVRWYLRYGLSYRDVEELPAERGVVVDHVTIYRWVQAFTADFINAARPSRHRTGDRWFVDETYVKVAGRWTYLYRAIDQHGQVIDVLISERRDGAVARAFFTRAISLARLRSRSPPTGHRSTHASLTSSCLLHGTCSCSTRTMSWKPITAGSKPGFARCED
jgi:hypothetical protein